MTSYAIAFSAVNKLMTESLNIFTASKQPATRRYLLFIIKIITVGGSYSDRNVKKLAENDVLFILC